MRLALKIDVDTLRGTREGVPNLVALLRKHGVGATFLFSLGPDHTGRAIRRVLRHGHGGKARRFPAARHYGDENAALRHAAAGPDIGRRAADEMHAVRDAGFETGVHGWDHVALARRSRSADATWTADGDARACERLRRDLRRAPR